MEEQKLKSYLDAIEQIHHRNEESYRQFQSIIDDIRKLSKEDNTGNLRMYGTKLDAWKDMLADGRRIHAPATFNEIKKELLKELRSVRFW